MKNIIFFLLLILSFQSFATEEESYDHCRTLRDRAAQIQKEISSITRELIRLSPGPESYVSRSVSGVWSCEEVSNPLNDLIARRESLELRLKNVRRDISRSCPRERIE